MGLYTLNLERERENWDTISYIKHSIIHYSHHVLTDSVVSNSLWPHGLLKAPLSMGFSRQEYWCGLLSPSPGDLPNPGIEPRAPALQVDSLPSEPPGKSKNTRVGSLSLLQGNFLTQKLNQDLLHCRWILYQLSYQGSPEYFALLPLEDLNPGLPHDRQGYPPLYKQVIMLHIISPGLFL